MAMFNFINGDGIYQYLENYYLIICTNDTESPYYVYDDKEEAMGIIEKLILKQQRRQHGVFLE